MQLASSVTEPVPGAPVIAVKRPDEPVVAVVVIAVNLLLFGLVQHANAKLEKGDYKMFYSAAIALRTGQVANLYDHQFYLDLQRQLVPSLPSADVKVYTHPPYELILFWPLSYLSYPASCYCWIAITLLLAVVCGRMLSAYAAVLGLFPLLIALLEQQDAVITLLLVIGCWLALRRGRDTLAGFLVGLALFRFQFVLPFALVLLFWKPRLLKGMVTAGMLVGALSLALVGPAGIQSYVHFMSDMAHGSASATTQHGYIVDPRTFPTLRGLMYELMAGGSAIPSAAATRILTVVVGLLGLVCLGFAWKLMRSDAPAEIKFSIAILAGLLLSPYLLMHDLVLLAIPFTLLRGIPARWPLGLFYVAPLVYLFYPHSQALLALPLITAVVMMMWQTRGVRASNLHHAFDDYQ